MESSIRESQGRIEIVGEAPAVEPEVTEPAVTEPAVTEPAVTEPTVEPAPEVLPSF